MNGNSYNQKNLALSGWSGSGTSTATMILAILLRRPYYNFGSVFRYFVSQLKKCSSDRIDIELMSLQSSIQPKIGAMVDKYVDHLLTTEHGIILETDLSVFRIGQHPNIYSIFLKTNFETRVKRFMSDSRQGDFQVLMKQDQALQKEYQKLWDIDIFDESLIAEKFNFVLNNSNLSILDTINFILQKLNEHQILDFEPESDKVQKQITQLSQMSGGENKLKLQQMLVEQGLMVPPLKMIKGIARRFPKQVKQLPDEFQQIFLN